MEKSKRDNAKALLIAMVVLLAGLSVALLGLFSLQMDENAQLSKQLSEMKMKYNDLSSLYSDLSSRYDQMKEDYAKQLQVASNNYNELKAKYDGQQSDYSSMKQQYDDMKAGYDDMKSKYDEILKSYKSLQTSYSSLQTSYEEMKKKFDTLQSSYDSLKSSYDKLEASYESLQSSYDDLQAIVSLQKSSVLDKDKTVDLDLNETKTISYDTPYAGYIIVNFTSTHHVYLRISSSYSGTEYARYPLEGTATSGFFKIPVFKGITRVIIRNPNYFVTATVLYTITYVY